MKLIKTLSNIIRTRLRIYFKGMYHPCWYPIEVKKIWKKCQSVEHALDVKNIKPLTFLAKSSVKNNSSINEIVLCGLNLSIQELIEIWNTSEEKIETEAQSAAHRFHWLVEGGTKEYTHQELQEYFNLIEQWLEICGSKYQGQAWYPYNVSERICSWVVFFSLTHQNVPNHLVTGLADQLKYLSNNLEYPASNIVNNHILNNARALYLGGSFIGNKNLIDLSQSIFKLQLPKMISSNGFLLEASSHYQLLLTKNINEVCKVASFFNDTDFYKWINTINKNMYKATLSLFPSQNIEIKDFPLIGDVSPDMKITWFDPRASKIPLSGWQQIWGETNANEKIESQSVDGWEKLKVKNYFILTYSHPSSEGYPLGHGHEDFGSFCLFYKNKPILIDIGRLNYAPNAPGVRPSDHSVVEIENVTLINPTKSQLSKVSYTKNFQFKNNVANNEMTWIVDQNLKRLWQRNLLFDQELEIQDTIFKSGSIKGSYYLAPQIIPTLKSANIVQLELPQIKLAMKFEGVEKVEIGETLSFPGYGMVQKTKKISWKRSSQTKSVIKIIFSENNI